MGYPAYRRCLNALTSCLSERSGGSATASPDRLSRTSRPTRIIRANVAMILRGHGGEAPKRKEEGALAGSSRKHGRPPVNGPKRRATEAERRAARVLAPQPPRRVRGPDPRDRGEAATLVDALRHSWRGLTVARRGPRAADRAGPLAAAEMERQRVLGRFGPSGSETR